jgi:hypothetical protein
MSSSSYVVSSLVLTIVMLCSVAGLGIIAFGLLLGTLPLSLFVVFAEFLFVICIGWVLGSLVSR